MPFDFFKSKGKDIELPLRKGEKPDPTIAKRQGKGTVSNILKGYGLAKQVSQPKKKIEKKKGVETGPTDKFMSRFNK